jgi:hypothetical protein
MKDGYDGLCAVCLRMVQYLAYLTLVGVGYLGHEGFAMIFQVLFAKAFMVFLDLVAA